MQFELAEPHENRAKIKVIGVGGAGGNAINNMIRSGMSGVDFVAVNTDAQALTQSLAQLKFQLGSELTKGLGAGARPEIGREAAIEDRDFLNELLQGSDMVFVTAGMGGGTGSGAAPVITQIAKELGILTVAVVTRPFGFEGKVRAKNAEQSLDILRQTADTLITIPNDRLLQLGGNLPLVHAFKQADQVLYQAVRGVTDIINEDGIINIDFADIRTIMEDKGLAMMGVGEASGPNHVQYATQLAINSPLLDDLSIRNATSILLHFSGSQQLSIKDVTEACEMIREEAHEDVNIIWGWTSTDELNEDCRVTVIATGYPEEEYISTPVEARINQQFAATPRRAMASGLGGGRDYDIPIFFSSDD